MAESKRCIFKWSGTQDADWVHWYAMTEGQILEFPVCEQCDIALDCLIIDPSASDEQIQEDLEFLRDWVLHWTEHGHHHLPNGPLAPGQEPPGQGF